MFYDNFFGTAIGLSDERTVGFAVEVLKFPVFAFQELASLEGGLYRDFLAFFEMLFECRIHFSFHE